MWCSGKECTCPCKRCKRRGFAPCREGPLERMLACSVMSDSLWPHGPHGGSLPGSSVHGIFQARTLEWAAMPSSRESSGPKDRTQVSCVSCIAGGFFTSWATREAPLEHTHIYYWFCFSEEPFSTSLFLLSPSLCYMVLVMPELSILAITSQWKYTFPSGLVKWSITGHYQWPFQLKLYFPHCLYYSFVVVITVKSPKNLW